MLKCNEIHHAVASGAIEEAGWMQRMELKFHLLMCHHCRRYVDQLQALGRGIRALARHQEPDRETCSRLEHAIISACDHGGSDPSP